MANSTTAGVRKVVAYILAALVLIFAIVAILAIWDIIEYRFLIKRMFQSLMVAGIHFAVAMLYQGVLAAMIDRAGKWLKRPMVNRVFDTCTGSILLFIGLRLATDK